MSDPPQQSRVQQFLALVAIKAADPAHKRILKAADTTDVERTIEAEFSRVIEELLHET